MLWRTLLCCLVLAGAVSVDAWEPLVQHQYEVDIRTLTALPEVADIYTGSLIRLKLDLTTISRTEYTAKVVSAKDGSLSSTQMPGGWASQIPQKNVEWQQMPISRKTFHVKMNENGTVRSIHFEAGMKRWEREILSGVVYQLQVKQPFQNPSTGKAPKSAAFHTKEPSLLGLCDVSYFTNQVTPAEVLHAQYPISGDMENHQVITKTWNLTNCKRSDEFTSGLYDTDGTLPVNRGLQSRILIKWNGKESTIKMVETNSTFTVPPQLYNKQKSMVATNFKATLLSKTRNPNPLPKPQNPEASEIAEPEQLQAYQGYMKDQDYALGSMPRDASYIRENYGWNSKTPYAMAYGGKRIGDASGRNLPEFVADLVEKISNLPAPEKLAETIVAVKHLRTMSVEEMDATHNILYQRRQQSEAQQTLQVFQNIVALTGTPESLQALFQWWGKKYITVQAFARYIHLQREAVFVLNHRYLETMKEIAVKVDKMQHQDQQALNQLRAAVAMTHTDIVRMAGRKYRQVADSVAKYYLARMEEAIKAQNYEELPWIISSLGNIATKSVIEPIYKLINGELNVPERIRLHAAHSAYWLNIFHPTSMKKIWLVTVVNTTMPHQLRCQAVPNLMQSNPPLWTLQQIAELTHNETNPHVVAQLSTAIRSAAELRGPHNKELAQKARAVLHLLKPGVYDASYSGAHFDSYRIGGTELTYTQLLNYIGSQDSLLPSSFQYFVKKNYNGYRPLAWQASGMVTSINDTLEAMLAGLFQAQYQAPEPSDISTTPFPRIHVQRRQKLEGHLNIPGYGFWAFDGQNLQKNVVEILESFNGRSIPVQTMSMSTDSELMYAVPNGIGQTFIYTYLSVYYNTIRGNVRLQKHLQEQVTPWSSKSSAAKSQTWSQQLAVEANIDITFARRQESKVGFITPWNSLDYMNGVDVNTQIRAPINVSVGVEFNNKLNDIQVSASVGLPKTKPVNMIQHSSVPYVTTVWLLGESTTTIGNPNTTLLHARPPVTTSARFGKSATGMDWRLDYYSEVDPFFALFEEEHQFQKEQSWLSAAYRWVYQQFKGYNGFSLIHFPIIARDIHISSLNLTYDPSESTAHTARFTWRIGDFPTPSGIVAGAKPQKQRYHPRSLGVPYSVEAPAEQQALAPGVSQRQILLNATFEGRTVAVFGLHGALRTNVMNESFSSTVQLWSKPAVHQQLHAALELSWDVPQVNLLNFKQALLESPNSTAEGSLTIARPNWAKPAVITLTGQLGRTQQREEYIRQSPMAKACLAEMQQGLKIQRACQNVTYWANSLDAYDFNIRYKHIPVEVKRVAFAAYSIVRQAAYSELQEDIFRVHQSTHTISVGVYVNNESTAFNFTLQSSLVNANVTNFPISSLARPLLPNAAISLPDRIGQYIYPQSYAPSFVWENGHIVTFDGKSYPMKPSTCWYIAVAYAPKWQANAPIHQEQVYRYKDLRFVVLTRQTKHGLLETKIVNNGMVVELRGLSNTPTPAIYINGAETQPEQEQPILIGEEAVLYILRNGEVAMHFSESPISHIYQDSQSVQITPRSIMKDSILGLGGNFNADSEDDFQSPAGCVRNDYEAFQAEWADCKLPSKESKCAFIHNNTVHGPQQIPRPQRIESPYTQIASNILDDSDSSSESSQSQETPLDAENFKSLLDIAGRASKFKLEGEVSSSGAGVQLSFPEF